MKRVLVSNSGGSDSAVICKKLKDDGFEVHSVTFDTNQTVRENILISAKNVADKYCVSHTVIPIPLNGTGHSNYYFNQSGEYILFDEETRTEEEMAELGYVNGICPNFAQVMISLGRAVALLKKCDEVYFGFKEGVITQAFVENYESIDNDMQWRTIRPPVLFPLIGVADKYAWANTTETEV